MRRPPAARSFEPDLGPSHRGSDDCDAPCGDEHPAHLHLPPREARSRRVDPTRPCPSTAQATLSDSQFTVRSRSPEVPSTQFPTRTITTTGMPRRRKRRHQSPVVTRTPDPWKVVTRTRDPRTASGANDLPTRDPRRPKLRPATAAMHRSEGGLLRSGQDKSRTPTGARSLRPRGPTGRGLGTYW